VNGPVRSGGAPYDPAHSDISSTVRAAWAEVMNDQGRDPDPDVPFLAAGGHSLAAARILARLRDASGVEIPISALLHDQLSLAELTRLATEEIAQACEPVSRRGLAGHPDEAARAASALAPLPPPLMRMWVWHRLHPDSPAYNIVRVLAVDGKIEPAALRASLRDLAHRHEALRCSIVERHPGVPYLSVGTAAAVPLSVGLLRTANADELPDALDAAVRGISQRPFPMDSPPLWRVGLVHSPAARRTWLVLVMHHLIGDLRASNLVLADLAEAYDARQAGQTPAFTSDAPSLLEHVAHESALIGSAQWQAQLEWWMDRLRDARPVAPVPLAGGPPDGSLAGTALTATLPVGTAGSVDQRLRSLCWTPAGLLLTAAAIVLAAWDGTGDPGVIGVPSARLSRSDDDRLVGFVLDTLPLRIRLGAATSFLEAHRVVWEALTEAMSHALPTFDEIVNQLALPRLGSQTPLIRLWFNDLTQARCPESFGGRSAWEHPHTPAWALFGLNLYLSRQPRHGCQDQPDGCQDQGSHRHEQYAVHLVVPSGVLDPTDAQELLAQIVRAASAAVLDPTRSLRSLVCPPSEPKAAAGEPASRIVPVMDAVARHADSRPTVTAVEEATGQLTYRQLHAEIEHVAAHLPGNGAPTVIVPARRDRRFIIRLLACLREGAIAALVDERWPERLRDTMATRVGATHTFPWHGEGAPYALNPHPAECQGDREYRHVLFTSGTTGDPLAVVTDTAVTYSAVDDLAARFELDIYDRVAFLSGPAHDMGLRDILLALRTGATLCIPPAEILVHVERLSSWLRDQRVTVINAPPTLLSLTFGLDSEPLPELRLVICGGSPLSPEEAAAIRASAPRATVVNGYGCTETPQLVTMSVMTPGEPVSPASLSAGRPLLGRRVEVRTAEGLRCDVGQLGEIWVAEPHIAVGYVGVTAPARFFRADGVAWFRTGDLARLDASGRVHLAGRADRQVLLNGNRVVLDDIEATARRAANVTAAVAEVMGKPGAESLRLWVQGMPGADLTEASVRTHLRLFLPPAAVPARITVVDCLPLGHTLKPRPPAVVPSPAAERPGRGAPDGRVRRLAESIAGTRLEPDANFFDAGFTSLSLLQLSAELSAELERTVPPLALFRHPNLRALSSFLSQSFLSQRPETTALPEQVTPPVTAEPTAHRLAAARSIRRDARARLRGQPSFSLGTGENDERLQSGGQTIG
jgi:non-ribosomal peptide synthetase component F/acyl carrier protein